MAEASTKPVADKLRLRPGLEAIVIGAPLGYTDQLGTPVRVGAPADLGGDQQFDFVQVFTTTRADLAAQAPKVRAAAKPNAVLWLTYPKGKALETDLNRDIVRATVLPFGLDTISQIAIDDVWSALRVKIV